MQDSNLRPEVSVVVPAYNAADTLPSCLDSVVAQTFGDMEVLLIDDGSTDDSGRILQEYADARANFRLIRQQNLGQYPTRNVALREVRGRYLQFIDCDDTIEPDLVEKAYYRAEADEADITMFGFDYLVSPHAPPDVDRWNMEALRHPSGVSDTFPLGHGYTWMKFYRKAFIDEHRLSFREDFYSKADLIFHWKSFSLAGRISVIPEVLYHYRVHENSVTGTIGRRFITVVGVMEAIKEELHAISDPKGLLRVWPSFALYCVRGAYAQLPTKYREEMAVEIRRFIARLEEQEKDVYRQPGRVPEHIRKFYMRIEQGDAPEPTRPHPGSAIARKSLELLLPRPLRTWALNKLQSASYTLSRHKAAENDLRQTIEELNARLHELSVLASELKKLDQNPSSTRELPGQGPVQESR